MCAQSKTIEKKPWSWGKKFPVLVLGLPKHTNES